MTRKPQTQTKVCGRPVHWLRHLICLVSPSRFDPNQNSMNSHVKFPLVHTNGEVSLVWIDPNCGLLCVWSVTKLETFRTNTRGCCRQRKAKTETWEETGGQNSSVKHGPTTLWSGRTFQVFFFHWKAITRAGQHREVEHFDPFFPAFVLNEETH